MSAAGRGAVRIESDYYPTPAKCVRQLLRDVKLPGGRWLEPGAGDGAIIRTVAALRQDVIWTAIELQRRMLPRLNKLPTVSYIQVADFIRCDPLQPRKFRSTQLFDVALGNPPFSLAHYFVSKAMQHADQVVFLLRLNWLGSSTKRRHIFEAFGVPDVFVLAERPSFVGPDGRQATDACDYGWMRWKRGGQKGTTQILWGQP